MLGLLVIGIVVFIVCIIVNIVDIVTTVRDIQDRRCSKNKYFDYDFDAENAENGDVVLFAWNDPIIGDFGPENGENL